MTVAVVLYQGGLNVPRHSRGIFDASWGDKLYRGIARNTTRPFRMVCYVDQTYAFEEPIEQRPFKHRYRNMFCLLEPFREDLGRVLFMGLDTIITGNIDRLMDYDGPFAMLPDPYVDRPCSGVMAFPYTPRVWQAFEADIPGWSVRARMGGMPSDMIFLATQPHELLDGTGIYSYKAHCRDGVPDDACIVYFHGQPKPHELNEPWIAEHWR